MLDEGACSSKKWVGNLIRGDEVIESEAGEVIVEKRPGGC